MALELISFVIDLAQAGIGQYYNFKALKPECSAFKQLLECVLSVLEIIQDEMNKGGLSTHSTTLTKPLRMLEKVIKEGNEVLRKCTKKKKLAAFALSHQLLGNLSRAKGDIDEAMQLIQTSGIALQGSIKEELVDEIQQVRDEVRSVETIIHKNNHEIAKMMERQFQKGGDDLVERLVDELQAKGIVTNQKDFKDQIKTIQDDKAKFMKEKVIFNQFILDSVLELSLEESKTSSSTQPNTENNKNIDNTIPDLLMCPISKDLMNDPVVLVPVGRIFDRESLCCWLVDNPCRDPLSGIVYDEPLSYIDAIDIRALIMERYGNDQFQRYDDSSYLNKKKQKQKKKNEKKKKQKTQKQKQKKKKRQQQQPQNVPIPGENSDSNFEDLDAEAQYQLGLKYAKGEGVAQDINKAFRLFMLAANKGHARGQCNLAACYEDGDGVEVNLPEAIRLYTLAANQGHALSQCSLAFYYENGWGVEKDLSEAIRLYTLAANQGDAMAQYILAQNYEQGIVGVEKDISEAIRLYTLASDQGFESATKTLERLGKKKKKKHWNPLKKLWKPFHTGNKRETIDIDIDESDDDSSDDDSSDDDSRDDCVWF